MITIGLFGSELRVTDGFTRTFTNFISQTRNANMNTNALRSSLNETERSFIHSTNSIRNFGEEVSRVSRNSNGALGQSFRNIRDEGQNTFRNLTSSMNSFSNSALGMISKITAGYLSLKGAIGLVKSSISEASSFQNASVFLESTYGETQGKEKYKWATQEAANTPFSEMDIANGLARTHALGMKDDTKSFKMYEDLGSFAKISGTGDLGSAIDAISDAQSGEWTRLQTITGAKRSALEDFAKEKNLGEFTNKKGQVTDKDKLMEVLQAYMDDKGITGMTDKFSKTFSGRMSTLKGNAQKSLAEMAGIKDDGTIREGSLFDNASKGMEKLINSINKFSKSESFDKISEGLGKVGNAIIEGFDYITEHPEVTEGLVKVGGVLIGLKVASSIVSPISGLIGHINNLSSISSVVSSSISSNVTRTSTSLLGLSKTLGIVGASIAAVESFINKNGVLHKGFNSLGNAIMGNSKENGTMHDYATESIAGLELMGLSGINTFAKATGNEGLKRWVNDTWRDVEGEVSMDTNIANGVKIYSDNEKDKWYSVKDVTDVQSNSSSINNNYKTDVHLNVDTIKETADVDNIVNEIANRLERVNKVRNGTGYVY